MSWWRLLNIAAWSPIVSWHLKEEYTSIRASTLTASLSCQWEKHKVKEWTALKFVMFHSKINRNYANLGKQYFTVQNKMHYCLIKTTLIALHCILYADLIKIYHYFNRNTVSYCIRNQNSWPLRMGITINNKYNWSKTCLIIENKV